MAYEHFIIKETGIISGITEEGKQLDELVIPEGTISIEPYGCWIGNYKSIVLPETLRIIGASAFRCCYNLTDVTIPHNVSTIGKSAFEDCKSLKSINILSDLIKIHDEAFINCENLCTINFPNTCMKFHIGNSFTICNKLDDRSFY